MPWMKLHSSFGSKPNIAAILPRAIMTNAFG